MKYTEEEKKAIEDLRKTVNYYNERFEENGKIIAVLMDNFDVRNLFVLLNLLEKYQKEIEKKDIERELALKGKQAEIEDNMREIIKEYYIPIEKYRQLEESCVSKESIKSILNKYGKKPIDEAVNFYKEIVELLGE